jgi:hypothetical protein
MSRMIAASSTLMVSRPPPRPALRLLLQRQRLLLQRQRLLGKLLLRGRHGFLFHYVRSRM